jgi:hypothetical protein
MVDHSHEKEKFVQQTEPGKNDADEKSTAEYLNEAKSIIDLQ